VDFTIGDGILRFARMDCSDLWVPGHSGVAAGRCDRARSAREPVETALLDTNTSSEKPINPMANGSRVSQAFQYKECTGLRSYFPALRTVQPGMRPTAFILNRYKLPI
jgi:hypothetical protein